ncbi:outer membrane lipoprotein Omp10 [Rhizobium halophytocola]|uniref:Outer membrane lipoprotein n=1 Tax=Rhizobium halophytocola TaxID=735519 RepID=A0ABS4DT97_9HYPH|nr:outer membrane lipoprotein Omp10 [Rhizobium halophytocola]MBP1848918.1 hypothetical protein [Rhizobium halophytocola]
MKTKVLVFLSVVPLALSACMSSPGPRRLPPPMQADGVEGAWVDPNGIVSTFQGGAFTTRTTDTNQMLASGTYTKLSGRLVEINMTSLIRNTQQKVNCALVTSNQLNCTAEGGSQFSLTRRS